MLASWCQEDGKVKEFVRTVKNRLQRPKAESFIARTVLQR